MVIAIREIQDECCGKHESDLSKFLVVITLQISPDIEMVDDFIDEEISLFHLLGFYCADYL